MKKIRIYQDYYGEDIKMYQKSEIILESGLTVLVGCNGAGKTTLLKQIEENLKKENIPYLYFDNLHDGSSHARSEEAFYGNFEFVAQSMWSSEGENIVMSLVRFARKIGDFFKNNKDNNELWILLDAIDSGLSVDAIVDLKEGFFGTIFERNPDKEIYIVSAANEYELARGEKCFDVINCRYISIKSYERYRNVILKSREQKNDRYDEEE